MEITIGMINTGITSTTVTGTGSEAIGTLPTTSMSSFGWVRSRLKKDTKAGLRTSPPDIESAARATALAAVSLHLYLDGPTGAARSKS
jgi:hypothetical protein